MTLTRSILGGARYPNIAEEDQQRIRQRVQHIHETLFGLNGAIEAIDVHAHQRAIPCYDPNHMTRQLAIKALQERHPGLYIGGNHIGGIGVKDCIRLPIHWRSNSTAFYPPTVLRRVQANCTMAWSLGSIRPTWPFKCLCQRSPHRACDCAGAEAHASQAVWLGGNQQLPRTLSDRQNVIQFPIDVSLAHCRHSRVVGAAVRQNCRQTQASVGLCGRDMAQYDASNWFPN